MAKPHSDLREEPVYWDDAHKFSPAPRHRRRIALNILKKLDYETCLDAGCAQPYLLEALYRQNKRIYGCDLSEKIIQHNRRRFPKASFEVIDIAKELYPRQENFDVVISSEVLEHIGDWRAALKNLAQMAKRYLLITVPCGKVHKIDDLVGHLRHFCRREIEAELGKCGLSVILSRRWGFPFHSLYKYCINCFDYQKTYAHFARQGYGPKEKALSRLLYFLFFFNDLFPCGSQLFILAEKDRYAAEREGR